jgi:hypothetical protein
MIETSTEHLRRCVFQLACLSAELAEMSDEFGDRGHAIAEAAAVVAHTSEELIVWTDGCPAQPSAADS